ncbi:MAG TPA: RNA polymerase factor sigma-54, partial [Stenotrophomonas sp.]|nr:RNA polymerase factor sigma-54 [Stenotrophomonas sp.]
MKTRLQTSLGQQLVLTPQLQQAIKLLQMSTTELELEIAQAVESNPLLDWADSSDAGAGASGDSADDGGADSDAPPEPAAPSGDDWAPAELDWNNPGSSGSFDDDEDTGSAAERVAEVETLADHLLWQLHLSHLSMRDRSIGAALIDALEEDGYLREPLATIAETLLPAIHAGEDEILTVLHQVQRFDPVGVAARCLGECLQLQLDVLPADTPGLALARQVNAQIVHRHVQEEIQAITEAMN